MGGCFSDMSIGKAAAAGVDNLQHQMRASSNDAVVPSSSGTAQNDAVALLFRCKGLQPLLTGNESVDHDLMANKRVKTLEAEVAKIQVMMEEQKVSLQNDVLAMIEQFATVVAQQQKEATTLIRSEIAIFMESMKKGAGETSNVKSKHKHYYSYTDGILESHNSNNSNCSKQEGFSEVKSEDPKQTMKADHDRTQCRLKKLKIPMFSGKDAYDWVYKADQYFEILGMTPQEQLRATTICFEDQALAWYRFSEERVPFQSWEDLKSRLLDRFHLYHNRNLCKQFLDIAQDGSVQDYQNQFERLASQLKGLPETILEGTYVKGLKPEIQSTLHILQPEGLDQAMKLAQMIEHKNTMETREKKRNSTIPECIGGQFRRLISESGLHDKGAKGVYLSCDEKHAPENPCASETHELLVDEMDDAGKLEEAGEEIGEHDVTRGRYKSMVH